MSELNWKAQSFLHKSTAKPLAAVVIILFFGLIGFGVFSYFYKVDRVVLADAEVISTMGEKELVAPDEGKIINCDVEVGQQVREGQILGQIQISQVDDKTLHTILNQVNDLYNRLLLPSFEISKITTYPLAEIKTKNPVIMKHLFESESSWKKYQLVAHESNFSSSKKLKILQMRKSKIQTKIDKLSRTDQIKFLRSLSDELVEQKHAIENEENSIKEDIHQKIESQKNETLAVLKTTYLGIYSLYENTLIRSYSEGVVARKLVQNSQHVLKGQKLMTVISDQIHFQLQLSIPALNIGKVEISNQLKISMESFPYQKYGHFQGQIESIDRMTTAEKKDFYQARSSLSFPTDSRYPANQIQLLPGMRAKAYILTDKLSIFQLISEKLFAYESF